LDIGSLLWSLAGLLLVFGVTYLVARIVQRVTNPMLPRLGFGRRVLLAIGIPVVIAVVIEIAIELAYAMASVFAVETDQLRGGFVERLFLGVPIVFVALFVVITRTVLALIATSRRQEQAVTADAAWEVARINETLHQERRFFAMQAHGPLQSAAAAAAARLDAATDEESLETVWAQASADLRDAIDVAITAPDDGRDLPAAVASLAAAWEGICAITLECSPDAAEALGRDWVANASAVEIVTEAIGNATMHGSATHIYVSVSLAEADEVRIEVVNDGAPVDDAAEEGMGSRTLDDITLDWKRLNTASGVHFSALVPVITESSVFRN
jgi:signal transduction histidine kinase